MADILDQLRRQDERDTQQYLEAQKAASEGQTELELPPKEDDELEDDELEDDELDDDEDELEDDEDDEDEDDEDEDEDENSGELASLTKRLAEMQAENHILKSSQRNKPQDNSSTDKRLESMEKAIQALADKQNAAPKVDMSKYADELGEDMVEMVSSLADQIVREKLKELTPLIDGLQKDMNTSKETQDEMRAKAYLKDRKVPDWRKINDSESFQTWIESNGSMKRVAVDAINNRDAQGVAEIFKMYKMSTGTGESGRKQEDKTEDTKKSKVKSKQRRATPGKRKVTKTRESSGDDTKIWTETEATKYLEPFLKEPFGEAYEKAYSRIIKAQAENRIRPQ